MDLHPFLDVFFWDVEGVDVGADVAPVEGGGLGRGEFREFAAQGFDVERHERSAGVGAFFHLAETIDERVLDHARGVLPQNIQSFRCDVGAGEFGGEL